MASVQWLSWSADAFARARVERKPVLLSIVAPWCGACLDMDRTSYADPTVAFLINERFVPIRVDADRRPDISDRYSLGGWPTTAFLTADGGIVGGGTYMSPARIAGALDHVLAAFTARASEIASRAVAAAQSREAPAASESTADLADEVFRSFDPAFGGFGNAPKFPLTHPVLLALQRHREDGDPRMLEIARKSLDGMGWGGLYDAVDGGFFRYSTQRDWQSPHLEKLLDVNAALTSAYLDAWEALGEARYRARALDVLTWAQTQLSDPDEGGWAGSQQADAAYYSARSAGYLDDATRPAVDRALYAAWNGSMISAALKASHAFDDAPLAEFAVKSLERLLLACYRPGSGVAHYFDGDAHVRGLLEDQFSVAQACLDAHDTTGNIVYEMMAEELARYAVRTMWDAERGGFFDRSVADEAERIGLMCERLKPFGPNCAAAMILVRLAASSGENDFRSMADATLASVGPLAARQGPQAAHYLLAVRAARSR